MAADQEKKVSTEDENKNKRVREEEVKDLKETKKVKTDEEKKEEKKNEKEVEKLEDKKEDKKEKSQDEEDKKEEDKEGKEEQEEKEEKLVSKEKDPKESQNENKNDPDSKEKSASQESKPKFVFGASSSFGSGFKVASSGPLNNEEAKKDLSREAGTPKPSAFGSGLSFGGGFGVLKASDKEDSKEKTPEPSSDAKERSRESSSASSSANGTKLQKQDVKSGEESEETIYQANAKLYQLADIEAGWKERGIGVIKVNKNVNTGKSRLVMRSRGILKVILNLSLVKGFTVQKGFVGSMQGEKFIRMVTQDDNKSPIQTAVKTGSKEIAEDLYDSIVKLIPK
ncbi:hypothetical protein ZYGR_0I03540 [Zygosaccharomyces rouxii]|uniref:ZYRO0C08448p n=2 Tax=Zygosaccharomyces rouxii TaxID=4956 RepID=C5DTG9_ZYGRC|nr:uncharacterized protein ZYRO0C08448g [Zygosaccharomyces rouxii]KAH9201741.1 RanBP1 domain-containing protein [Zygosaccharomyces rouxii]GAV48057.1 hypothetical protein ZYGR_0I03540 [Zygosaccharomyces rouxii]CAR27080.1 ZYRO0C08448p [Zygosaccharomyces rouxii]